MIELNRLYNENCLKTMKRIPDKFVDLLLTDPPYAIGMNYDTYEDTEENWFALMADFIPEARRIAKMVIMPSCQIRFLEWIYKNHPPDWLLCWYKGSVGHNSYIGFNDWEPHLVYGRVHNKMNMHDYFQTKSSPKLGTNDHPCPKPMEWAKWLIIKATKPNEIVYDPFSGSGVTLQVAKFSKRQWIGSEISKKYCTDAINNINQTKGLFSTTEKLF